MEEKHKSCKGLFKAATAAGIGDMLEKINTFTRRPYAADELFIGQMRLANNCIDRDNERYREDILEEFAKTVVRKLLLLDHAKAISGAIGKFFDVVIEKLPLNQAIQETGEQLRLPEGSKEVHFLAPWFYIPKEAVPKELLSKLESGVVDYVSIGFRAERLVPVTDQKGTALYHEYQGRGEVTEGSLVYLGAQYGASVKAFGEDKNKRPSTWRQDNPLVPNHARDMQKIDQDIERARAKNPLIPEQEKRAEQPEKQAEKDKTQRGKSTDWRQDNPLMLDPERDKAEHDEEFKRARTKNPLIPEDEGEV